MLASWSASATCARSISQACCRLIQSDGRQGALAAFLASGRAMAEREVGEEGFRPAACRYSFIAATKLTYW